MDREQLGEVVCIAWEGWDDWETAGKLQREHFQRVGEAVAAAVLPAGHQAVNTDYLAALERHARAALKSQRYLGLSFPEYMAVCEEEIAALDALRLLRPALEASDGPLAGERG